MKKKETKQSIIKYLLITIVVLIFTLACFLPVIRDINYGLDLKGGFEVLYNVKTLDDKSPSNSDMLSTYKSIVNRIDTLGVSEPEIVIEGTNIRVKLPGVKNEEQARERLSTPAVLTFRNTSDELLMNASILKSPGASLSYDEKNQPVVALNISDNKTFYETTKKISKTSDQLIVIWLDFEEGVNSYSADGKTCGTSGESKCISAATVSEGFMNNVIIQGSFSQEEAQSLVDLINSGSLPTKLSEISTKSVDASFGNETLYKAGICGLISVIAISLFLIIRYRFSGFISSICLIIYTLLTFLVFNLLDGVLTLPGIAALILGIGMGVDCTIISLERVCDELNNNSFSLERAFINGNKESFVAILDANITTLIATIIMFLYGESSVKGFATVLTITIVLTILILVYLNRYMLKCFVMKTTIKESTFISRKRHKFNLNFTKLSKIFITISSVILLSGVVMFLTKGMNFGVDFSGGTDITVRSENKIKYDDIKDNFKDYKIDEKTIKDEEVYIKVLEMLDEEEVKELKENLKDYKVEINVISNVVKKELTKNALIALVLASLAIVVYASFRFSFNYGLTAIIMLIHDILIVVSVFAITQVQINFIFIASILTILGYSINDTIIIFDRIRYNKKKLYNNNVKTKEELMNVINISSNESLIRNILTALTSTFVIVVLMVSNIKSLLPFNLSILVGLVAGAISSIFIMPYILYLFEKRTLNKPVKTENKKNDEPQEKLIKGINS